MGIFKSAEMNERAARSRRRSETIETVLIVALAALVLFKGAPAIAGIALTTGGMMVELLSVLAAG